MEDKEEYVLTDEDKANLARRLMLQSPPGELLQVASDVRTLLGADHVLNSVALDVFREYNTEQMVAVNLPDSMGQVLVTKAGEIDSSHYLDPKSGQVVEVDHIKQVCINARPAEESENTPAALQPFRKSLEDELAGYMADCFPSAQFAVYAAESEDGASMLTVCVSSAKFSPQNYWNGRWRSYWTATLSPGSGAWELRGEVKVLVHYFEEGNVQLDTAHQHSATTSAPDPDGNICEIVKAIKKAEHSFLQNLEETYKSLSETTFKELRRNLPVTRTKFQWADNSHSLASELKRNKA
mmetsp:Transcript_30134/g.41721  ORF Transcript_30134/g.41721 Transcript_30134/m.41721 type:complete len:296 (-) Transcript_30134:273-1160(-)|eukprot:CAMPEP_0196579646 /NCGR_PEP_ID=MMETSP1081-20130531/24062_1 /TAXON_ID=36882 /ORGANISM="Pyramimonas amylifera, Strain CCMP720" /LENGTH=295 /DNA_ID=CAMNT_0041899293 /DNA_START=76 /DNA_END=963 /DNA_ORIENTATION=+